MNKLLLPLVIIVSLVAVFSLTNRFQENTTLFYGIADNQEQSVSFQEGVKITDISIIEGQFVEQGIILLKAERSSLMAKKNQLNGQVDELTARQDESQVRVNVEIQVLKAQEKTDIFRIDSQIRELRSNQKINRELYQNIMGVAPDFQAEDSIQVQINSLMKQRQIIREQINTQISSLVAKVNAANEPIIVQKNRVAESLNEISRQEAELIVKADFSGRIGSIQYKRGERVASFQPILTVYGLYPKKVKGYIHENVSNNVKIGQQVWIHSLSSINKNTVIEGRVESLGSRIVEYPERLKKNPMIKSWGREVNIRLPRDNTLLLGEKVQISFSQKRQNNIEAFFKPLREKNKILFPRAYVNQINRGE